MRDSLKLRDLSSSASVILSFCSTLLFSAQFCSALLCFALLCFALLCSTLFCYALLFFTLLCSSLHSTPASTPASSVLVQCFAGDAVVDLAECALKSIRLLSSLLLGRGAR